MQLDAAEDRLLGATLEVAEVEDQGSVGIHQILEGALLESSLLEFLHRVMIGNDPVLVESASGNPAATLDAEGEGGVEGGPVHAGLGSGDDFHGETERYC